MTASEAAFSRGSLVVAAPVFAELLVAPGRKGAFVDAFFGRYRGYWRTF